MTTSNICALREIDVHVLYPSDRQDCVRVIAETRADAISQVQHLLPNAAVNCLFMALFTDGPTNLATA